FCPSCGKRMDTSETEEPQGIFWKLVGAVGVVIAIPLAIIVTVVSTALPLLVVVAFFMGPGDTWDMMKSWIPGSTGENAACSEFKGWYNASAKRSQEASRLAESYQSSSTTNPA